jgi:membrane-bound lytic murein transglycosylase
MKKKIGLSVFVFSFFSIMALAQSENKNADTTAARQMILKNSGEKNLSQQLKEKQIKEQLVILKTDSISVAAQANTSKRKTTKCKQKKKPV